MFRPEVWMSDWATPRSRSALVTFRIPALASPSADVTEPPVTWTPIDNMIWLGTPVTVPVPVTVIRPLAGCAEVNVAAAAGWEPPLLVVPIANAPTSSAADATPIAAARVPGEVLIAIGDSCSRGALLPFGTLRSPWRFPRVSDRHAIRTRSRH